MPPAEDARLLLNLVQRHLRSLEASLRPEFPEEDWGFTAPPVCLPAATICCSSVRWLTLSCPMT